MFLTAAYLTFRRGGENRVGGKRRLAAFDRVVKRAGLTRENNGFVRALSPGPPVMGSNGESRNW